MSLRAKIDTLQKIEVAEGVEILLRPAGPVPRALAFLIDLLLMGGIWIACTLLLVVVASIIGTSLGGLLGVGFYFLGIFLLNWWYFVFFERGPRGASPGKRAMGLRVVRTSGAPVGWGAAILRNFLRVVDGIPILGIDLLPLVPLGMLGMGFTLLTRRFQRIGDLLADTVVVYQQKSSEVEAMPLHPDVQRLIVPSPPPRLLSKEEQQAVILFLERAGLWSDARKEEIANHVQSLTGASGRAGVLKLLSMGQWLRDS